MNTQHDPPQPPAPLLFDAAWERKALRLLGGEETPATLARAAGSPSAKAFSQDFRRVFLTPPEGLLALGSGRPYRLDYGGPFHVGQTLRYLGRDSGNLAERVDGSRYRRYFPVGTRPVPATLTLGEAGCDVTPETPLKPGEALAFHRLIIRTLGLDQPLAPFYAAVKGHSVLGPLARALAGVRVPQVPSLWEALCWAVVGQQINLAFAYRLRNRLIALGNEGDVHTGESPAPPYPFPGPEQLLRISDEAWRQAQFSRQKGVYLKGLATAFAEGTLREDELAGLPVEDAEAALSAVKGLGPWSVAYALLRGQSRLDVLPVGDAGLRSALRRQFHLAHPPDVREQRDLMEPFRPWRGLATYYLWKSLDLSRQEPAARTDHG